MAGPLAAADARLAWRISLPLRFTTDLESLHLIDEYVLAWGSDGTVRCLLANSGAFLWEARIAPPYRVRHGPVAAHASEGDEVVFALLGEAVFVDAFSGFETRRVRLRSTPTAAPAAGGDTLYIASMDRRIKAYDVAINHVRWEVGTRGQLRVAPIYLPERDLLVTADQSGEMTGFDGTRRQRRLHLQLDGEPRGWLTVGRDIVYVATSGFAPMLHAVDLESERLIWQFRLADRPEGGPVVTDHAVYQATIEGGLHRIGLTEDLPHWYSRNTRRFLAEWPDRIVLLGQDGTIFFADEESGQRVGDLPVGTFTDGISNTRNAAVIVANRGDLLCLIPATSGPLSTQDFRLTEPDEPEPALDAENDAPAGFLAP